MRYDGAAVRALARGLPCWLCREYSPKYGVGLLARDHILARPMQRRKGPVPTVGDRKDGRKIDHSRGRIGRVNPVLSLADGRGYLNVRGGVEW